MSERIHLPQVLALAGYSRTTLRNRQLAGAMPLPIDRGARGGIFDKAAVLKALGMTQDEKADERDPWDFESGALNRRLSRPVRGAEAPSGRQRKGILPSSGKAPTLRVASDRSDVARHPPARHG